MRRASLVAPLLLIALGALFLARNLYPEFPFADYIARYWPYVLILWGVLRLAEICYWSLSAKPLPSRGISGGEWVLVVFLCMLGIGIHVAHDTVRWWPEHIPWESIRVIGDRFDYPVNAEKPASKTPRIVIEDFRGDIQVTGSDADVVKLTGRKSIRAMDKDGAEKADKNSDFEIAGDPNQMTVRLHESGLGGRISSNLEMTVPKGASLEAKRRDGDVRVSNLQGAVVIGGHVGDIDAHDIGGAVNIDVNYAGDVQLKNLAKEVRFKTPRTEFTAAGVPGSIHIDGGDFNADGLTGPARLSSRSRDVRIRDFSNTLDVELDRGDLNLEAVQAPLARLQATVRSGDVHLVVPDSAGFSLRATTKNGDISNGLGTGFHVDTDRRKQTLQGATGSGPEITLDLERGDISISKGASKPPASKLPAKDASHPLETINQ